MSSVDEESVDGNGENDVNSVDDNSLVNEPTICYERMVAVLRDGNEIQRISVLRTLPGLVSRNNVENYLVRILPEIQETLSSGSAGLELHFEASQAYKDIVEQAARTDLDLCSQILQGIVQNLDAQDSIACSAWLETLLEIITHLPLPLVQTTILPLAVTKAQQLNSVQSRLTASKLLGRLAYKLDPVDVKMQIVPLVQSLCQDIDAGIRASVCQQLSIVAYSLLLPDLKSLMLPLVIEFSKDEDESVREANLDTLVSLLNLFDEETCSQILVPLVERFVDEILERKTHKTLVSLSKNYGALCQGLNRVLSNKQKNWFMEKFCEMCQLGAQDDEDENNSEFHKMEFIARKYDPQTTFQTCRENCAYNFSILAELAGKEQFKSTLLPHFKKLCQDGETDVRRNVAAIFHELVKFLGPEAPLLIDSFIDLVYSGEPEVIAALTCHLSVILEYLYQLSTSHSVVIDDNGNSCDDVIVPYSHTQLTRILLACNRLIRNCSNWRCHEQYLRALTCMSKCVSKDVLLASYVPMIKEEVFNTRALPCRIAALTTLIIWMKDLTSPAHLQSIIEFLTTVLIKHKSCHKRILYLNACQLVLDHMTKPFFKQHFFRPAIKLANDPVMNIRVKLCKMLPSFKSILIPNVDQELLIELESAVRIFMNDSNNGYMNEILRAVVNELSNVEPLVESKPKHAAIKAPPVTTAKEVAKEKRTAEIVAVQAVPQPKHQTTTVVYLHQDLDISAKLPPPSPTHQTRSTKTNTTVVSVDEEPKPMPVPKVTEDVELKPTEIPKKSRSPSPPHRRTLMTSSSSSGMPKKTAVIRPRQLVTRSPSPRPPFNDDYISKKSTSSYITSRPPTSSSSSSSSGSSYSSRRSSNDSSSSSYSSKPYTSSYSSSSSSERIVPIKLVHSSSGSSLSHSSSASSLRPPIPVSTYKRSKDRTTSSRQSDESSKSSSLQNTRTIPIIRTGSVLKSVEKFESSDLNSNRPPLRSTPSSSSSSSLGYNRALNRSFSSFSASRGSGDYNNNGDRDRSSISSSLSSSARRGSLATSTPSDRSYSLTRVRSGSAITVPSSSSSSYSRLQR